MNSGAVRDTNNCGPRSSAIAHAHHFARNGLVARNEGLGLAAEVEIDVAALDALGHAVDQFAHAILEGIDHLRALGLADALHDHLLGGLRGDAPEFGVLDLLLDVFADLRTGALVLGIHQAQLPVGRFHLAVVGDHFPAAEGFVVTALMIDGDADVGLFLGIALLGGRRQRRLERTENHIIRHRLLGGHGFHDHQQVAIHFICSIEAGSAASSLSIFP